MTTTTTTADRASSQTERELAAMKAMERVSRGAGFRGVLKYVFADPNAKFLGISRCMMARDEAGLRDEFRAARALRPKVAKPVWHQALRLPRGESVPERKLLVIGHDYMARMGFDGDVCQYAIVMHDHPDGRHIHIVASRVRLDGTLWLGKQENLISTRVVQDLETAHGLQITKGPTYEQVLDAITGHVKHRIKPLATSGAKRKEVRQPKRKETQRHRRMQSATGVSESLPRTLMVAVLQEARLAGRAGGLSAFLRVAESGGVQVHATSLKKAQGRVDLGASEDATPGKQIYGLVFESLRGGEPYRIAGSKLGAAFSGPQLLAELGAGGERDLALLQQRRQRFGPGRILTPIPSETNASIESTHDDDDDDTAWTDFDASAPRRPSALRRLPTFNSLRALSSLALVHHPRRNEGGVARRLPATEPAGLVAGRSTGGDGLRRIEAADRQEPEGRARGQSLAPPRPVTPARVAPPSHDDRYRAEVERVKRNAGKAGLELDHPRVRKALDEREDRYFPGRRAVRVKRDQELNQRLGVILAAAGPNASSKGDGAYLRVAQAWLATERGAGREPDRVAWRDFDLQQGAHALAQAFIPVQAVAALTRLSPGAVRNLEALEAHGVHAHAAAGDVVDKGYGLAVMGAVRAVKPAAEAREDSDGHRRRGPYEPR